MALFDRFGRIHNYLRISLTDHCNMRCSYCMPDEQYDFLPSAARMLPEEIAGLADVFVKLGVDRIRMTGGEPLSRRDFPEILRLLSGLNTELLLTTNGALLHLYRESLLESPLRKVNLSLDALNAEGFKSITRRNDFDRVWRNLMLLLEDGFSVKINVVATPDNIPADLKAFIALTRDYELHVRFIEYMPFDRNGWDARKVVTADFMLRMVQEEFDVIRLHDEPHATAKKYKVIGHPGTFAFITTMTEPFCGDCNRLRLTADGKIKNCLFGKDELDLLTAWRRGEDVELLIRQSLNLKHAVMGGQFPNGFQATDASGLENRSMIKIGG